MHSLIRSALAIAWVGWAASAHAAGNADRCADAAERGQAAWKKKQLLTARAELRACGTSRCPRVVRDDCAVWAGQVEDAIPTVVFTARGERGEDLTAFELTVDGARVASYPLGSALELDPGEHLARIADGVHAPIEQTFVLREGEKRRVIDVRFAAAPKPERPSPATPPERERERKTPASVWIVGGLGVAALGAFGVLGVTGLNRYHGLRDDCRVTRVCSDAEISSTRTQLWVADGLGIAGALALAAAIWLYVDR